MSRQQFFLNSANWQNLAAQRNFTRHGYILSHSRASQRGRHGCSHRDTSGGTIFWNSPFGNMNMEVAFANEVKAHPQTFCPSLDTRQSGLSRLLHYFTKLAGEH